MPTWWSCAHPHYLLPHLLLNLLLNLLPHLLPHLMLNLLANRNKGLLKLTSNL